MSEILIYTDPHRGLVRQANMTSSSNKAREEATGKHLLNILKGFVGRRFCLGDFFDKASNPEEVILGALPLADETDLIMAGNHDLRNQESKESSLRILQELYPGKTLITDPRTNEGYTLDIEDTLFCFAPHALAQESYMAMIDGLKKDAEGYQGQCQILCLHCNYDMSEDMLSEGTLNLSREKAHDLLHYFHYILIGHVHTPADHMDGRVKIVGSVFPTAFDNLENKRALVYDTETHLFNERRTWDARFYTKTKASEFVDPEIKPEYVELENDLPPGEAQKMVVRLFKEGALGVRLRQPELEGETAKQALGPALIENLPSLIEEELASSKPHLVDLWKELKA